VVATPELLAPMPLKGFERTLEGVKKTMDSRKKKDFKDVSASKLAGSTVTNTGMQR